MKLSLLPLAFTLLSISCSKKNNPEPEKSNDITNELVGTSWQRTLNPDLYNYLDFKTGKEVAFTSKLNGELSIPLVSPYTLNKNNVVYTSDGFNYSGTISGDTLAVMGTTGFLMIYVKVK
jgi:hypothetical protein